MHRSRHAFADQFAALVWIRCLSHRKGCHQAVVISGPEVIRIQLDTPPGEADGIFSVTAQGFERGNGL
jgi:hypothetical protein